MSAILEQINATGQRFIEYTFTVLVQSSLPIMILLLLEVTRTLRQTKCPAL
jgi:hypothetical protein